MIWFFLAATLLLLIGFVLTRVCAQGSAATRHGIWAGIFLAILLLPLATSLLTDWRLSLPILEPVQASSKAALSSVAPREGAGGFSAIEAAGGASFGMGLGELLAGLWFSGVLVGLFTLLRQIHCLFRLTRTGQALRPGDLPSTSGQLPSGLRTLCTDRISSPMTWGLFRPVLLLPGNFRGWPADSRASALHHELAHIHRRDWLLQILARLVCLALWFNPLAWIAAGRMHLEAERACDDAVLLAGSPASSYAGHLLELAERMQARTYVPVLGMTGSSLSARVRAILDPMRRRQGTARPQLAACLGLCLSFALGAIEIAPTLQGKLVKAPADVKGLAARWEWALSQPVGDEFLVGYSLPSPRSTLDLGAWRLPAVRREGRLLSERVYGPGIGRELWSKHGELAVGGRWGPMPGADAEYEKALLFRVQKGKEGVVIRDLRSLSMWLPFESELPLLWLGAPSEASSARLLSVLGR